jgi:hypothetical protein
MCGVYRPDTLNSCSWHFERGAEGRRDQILFIQYVYVWRVVEHVTRCVLGLCGAVLGGVG